ncbi:hypothetical protein [Candidatus Poriferisodalis sp.]|uniref:hypothetical protein n=1 Tax=Candidatus Poriferisodalis sp. TaxID=3101277 RepID=UPI003B515D22
MLVLTACATTAERVAEATEPTVNASTTPRSEAATTLSSPSSETIKPARDTSVRSGDEYVDQTGEEETYARDERAAQVTEEPALTVAPELSREPLPTIEAGSRVTWTDDETLPEWPFEGLVQLAWTDVRWGEEGRWHLRFYRWTDSGVGRGWTVGVIPLPELSIACVGDVGLVSHGLDGIELGGPAGSVSASFLVPWGGAPERLKAPSDALLAEIRSRPSNADAEVTGDIVSISHADTSVRFVLRRPTRIEGDWWNIQARHDGDVFVVTVHPANHPCFSGVTWLSAAATGEMLACGTNTAATKFIVPDIQAAGPLVLPAADEYRTVLSCPYPLGPGFTVWGQPR